MGGLMTAMGFGFLGAAKEKIHIPGPKRVVKGVGRGVKTGVKTAVKPVVWVGRKLRHPFKKAHDDGVMKDVTEQQPQNDNRQPPKPKRHQL
jgi:hypothetical protein